MPWAYDLTYVGFDPNSRESIEEAIASLDVHLSKLPKEEYADVLFPGAVESWTYRIPAHLRGYVEYGDFVSVDRGQYASWVGRVQSVHNNAPNCSYVYEVDEVIR